MEQMKETENKLYTLFTLAVLLTGCYSAPRFTHVDVNGDGKTGPAPFVFFDQKTAQMCWAGSESVSGKSVTITLEVHDNAVLTEMPVCKDLK